MQRFDKDAPRRTYLAIKFVKRMMDSCPAVAAYMAAHTNFSEYMHQWLHKNLAGYAKCVPACAFVCAFVCVCAFACVCVY
jgi:hypothetical protein